MSLEEVHDELPETIEFKGDTYAKDDKILGHGENVAVAYFQQGGSGAVMIFYNQGQIVYTPDGQDIQLICVLDNGVTAETVLNGIRHGEMFAKSRRVKYVGDAVKSARKSKMKKYDASMLDRAYDGSYYTITGAGGNLDEWKNGYQDMLNDEGIGQIREWIEFTGQDMNEYYGLEGEVRYQDDLHFLAFCLEGLDVGKLAIFKLQMGDRWFDDIVDNNRSHMGKSSRKMKKSVGDSMQISDGVWAYVSEGGYNWKFKSTGNDRFDVIFCNGGFIGGDSEHIASDKTWAEAVNIADTMGIGFASYKSTRKSFKSVYDRQRNKRGKVMY